MILTKRIFFRNSCCLLKYHVMYCICSVEIERRSSFFVMEKWFLSTRCENNKSHLPLLSDELRSNYFICEAFHLLSIYPFNIDDQIILLSRRTFEVQPIDSILPIHLFEKIILHNEIQLWKYRGFSSEKSNTKKKSKN